MQRPLILVECSVCLAVVDFGVKCTVQYVTLQFVRHNLNAQLRCHCDAIWIKLRSMQFECSFVDFELMRVVQRLCICIFCDNFQRHYLVNTALFNFGSFIFIYYGK